MGYDGLAVIARKLRTRQLVALGSLMAELRTSDNLVVRRCVDVGLPAGMSTPLQDTTVVCPLCQKIVRMVPCPACNLRGSWVVELDPEPEGPPPPLPAHPTPAIPGSLQKLRILESRLARGEALFHPKDARIPDKLSV
jgi:hypothetical protein